MARYVAIVAVVSGALTGQQDMKGVMTVVIPLCAAFPGRRIGERVEQARLIVVVLQHKMNVPAALCRERADRGAHLAQQVCALRIGNGVNGVEPQAIETKVTQPIERVFDGKLTDFGPPIVDGIAPWRM